MDASLRKRRSIQLSAYLAAFFLAWSIRATVLTIIDEGIGDPLLLALYSNAVKFLLWVVPTVGFVLWFRGVRALSYLGVSAVPDARAWLHCAGISGVFFAAVLFVETTVGHKSISATTLFSTPVAALLLQYGLTPLFEEVLFRGLLLKELLALAQRRRAIAIDCMLFVAIHAPYWISHGADIRTVLANSTGVLLFSLLACWLYVRSGSIWPPVVAHALNNIVSGILVPLHQ